MLEEGNYHISKMDYYKILNINKSASKKKLKAFRKLAHKYHRTKAEDKKFKEINETYQVCPIKRRQYDQL